MKVIDLLDKMFFEKGDKEIFPLIRSFASDERNEIFGICESDLFKTKRVMIISPEAYGGLLLKYALYLGEKDGSYARVGKDSFCKAEAIAIYGSILSNPSVMKIAAQGNVRMAATELADYIEKSKAQSKEIKQQKGE